MRQQRQLTIMELYNTYENDSKEMLNIYFPCLLAILLSMQGSTLELNTTYDDV